MEQDVFQTLILLALIWFVCSFYWTRVISVALVMFLWGLAVMIAPIYLVSLRLAEHDYILAFVTAVVCILPATLWVFCAFQMREWITKKERLFGGFWKPWNSRRLW